MRLPPDKIYRLIEGALEEFYSPSEMVANA